MLTCIDVERVRHILVTNDDGVLAPGLWALAEALRPLGSVVVVAPDREQSGVGTSVSLLNPLRLSKMPGLSDDIPAYAVEGTPADCVVLATGALPLEGLRQPIDLVVAGINDGANLGDDVLISGTVGAALRAYLRGIPAIAVSIASLRPRGYDAAASVARGVADWALGGSFGGEFFLNVNLPDMPLSDVAGVAITRLARRSYRDLVDEQEDRRGRKFYWIARGQPEWQVEEGTDAWAIRNHRISVTPLHHDTTQRAALGELAELERRLRGVVEGAR